MSFWYYPTAVSHNKANRQLCRKAERINDSGVGNPLQLVRDSTVTNQKRQRCRFWFSAVYHLWAGNLRMFRNCCTTYPAARAGLQKSYDFSTLAGSMPKYGKSSITFLLLLSSSYPLAVYSLNIGKDTYLFCSCYSPALRKPQKTSENPLRIHNPLFFHIILTNATRKP